MITSAATAGPPTESLSTAGSSTDVTGFELTDVAAGRPVPPDATWIPAVVPGGVHESLLAAGKLEDPYRGQLEGSIRWIEGRDWWYRATVDLPDDLRWDERLSLICHGLDTTATLWLDDDLLGRHQNQHRPFLVDLTGRAPGSHQLSIRFTPPLAGLEPSSAATDLFARLGAVFAELAPADPSPDEAPTSDAGLLSDTMARATLRRKAIFSWGWDFGPRVPSLGIGQPVELRRERAAAISGHHVRADAVDRVGRQAVVEVRVEVDAFATDQPLSPVLRLTSPGGVVTSPVLELSDGDSGSQVAQARVVIDDAELWWTHDLGAQPLYDVEIDLFAGDALVDRVRDRIGLRTIRLDRTADPEGGRYFRFILNGVPIYARGAAWLPPSMLVGSIGDDRYRDLVRLAREGEMTMLRVWGGGTYEKDAFWRACDEEGILVWLDFMFACCDYPTDDPELAGEVESEAIHQVRRLRNHASLALWCGNNEVQMIHESAYGSVEPGPWGHQFFTGLLPGVVAEHSPGTSYWPGSPYGEDDPLGVNGVNDGDRHAWEVWHGLDFGTGTDSTFESVGEARHFWRYAQDRGKFISEFGIHASPELSTLRRWVPAGELELHDAAFDHRNKDHPKNKGDALLEVETGLAHGIEQYVDFTMATQAEGLKFGIEHYRRRQPHNSGTLIWQFNDVWPGFSWSVVDYDLVPKAGYYFAKRAYAPVMASFRRTADDGLELWIANSTADPISTSADIQLASFDGHVHLSAAVPVEAPAATATLVWSSPDGIAASDRYAWVSNFDGLFPANRLFFDHLKNLPFPAPKLDVRVRAITTTSATVEITAAAFAYFVHILSPAPGTRFSDNYVDLRPGETRRIEVSGMPTDRQPEELIIATYDRSSSSGYRIRRGTGER